MRSEQDVANLVDIARTSAQHLRLVLRRLALRILACRIALLCWTHKNLLSVYRTS
jgi:hypothetical protein